jgi:hypothetical protein
MIKKTGQDADWFSKIDITAGKELHDFTSGMDKKAQMSGGSLNTAPNTRDDSQMFDSLGDSSLADQARIDFHPNTQNALQQKYLKRLNNLAIDESSKEHITNLIEALRFGDADDMLFEYDKNDWDATRANYLDDRFSDGDRLDYYNEMNEMNIPMPVKSELLRFIWQGAFGKVEKIMSQYEDPTKAPMVGREPEATQIDPWDRVFPSSNMF